MNTPPLSARLGERFEDVIVPHLDAAYRLARWLTRNEADAEDVVQEASLRAFRYFRSFEGQNGRAWFLRIVRNVCWGSRKRELAPPTDLFDEERHSRGQLTPDPETLLLHADDASLIDRALSDLPGRFRELIVLRELEELSYQQLADILEIPIGTVMSGLSRARHALRTALQFRLKEPGLPDGARPADREPVGCAVRASGRATGRTHDL